MNKFNKNNFFGEKIASIERNFESKSRDQLPAPKGCTEPHIRPVSHILDSPVLNRTVVDNINSCSLGSILKDNLCYKTTYSRKIELNKLIHISKVKTATTFEALPYFIYFTYTIRHVLI